MNLQSMKQERQALLDKSDAILKAAEIQQRNLHGNRKRKPQRSNERRRSFQPKNSSG